MLTSFVQGPMTFVSPRIFKILGSFGIKEIEQDFEKLTLRRNGAESFICYQDVEKLFRDDDYIGIDRLTVSAGLKLVYEERQAKKRREFRTKQRSILCGKTWTRN